METHALAKRPPPQEITRGLAWSCYSTGCSYRFIQLCSQTVPRFLILRPWPCSCSKAVKMKGNENSPEHLQTTSEPYDKAIKNWLLLKLFHFFASVFHLFSSTRFMLNPMVSNGLHHLPQDPKACSLRIDMTDWKACTHGAQTSKSAESKKDVRRAQRMYPYPQHPVANPNELLGLKCLVAAHYLMHCPSPTIELCFSSRNWKWYLNHVSSNLCDRILMLESS